MSDVLITKVAAAIALLASSISLYYHFKGKKDNGNVKMQDIVMLCLPTSLYFANRGELNILDYIVFACTVVYFGLRFIEIFQQPTK